LSTDQFGRHRPALAALGEYVWADNRGERFTTSLNAILHGLQAARRIGSVELLGISELRKRSP